MTESNDNQDTMTTEPKPARARGRRWLLLALPAVLLAGSLGTRAYAFGRGGPDGGFSPEQVDRFLERRMDRVLDRIDATADQRTRIKATVTRLRPEMKALHDEKAKLRTAGKNALSAQRIDRSEIERLRREALKLADRGSSLMSLALVEIGEVLTPEQRKQALELFEGRRHWRR